MSKEISQTLSVSHTWYMYFVQDKLEADATHRPRKDTSTPTSTTSDAPIGDAAASQAEKLPTPPKSLPSESLPTPMFHPEPFDFSMGFQDAHHMSCSAPTTTGDDTHMTGTMPFFSGM